MMLAKTGIVVLALLTMVSPLTAQKGGGTSDVRLRVSIADRSATPPPDYRVESDGMGEYVDGVSAGLNRYGDLIVNFQADPRTGRRRVHFDYSCTGGLGHTRSNVCLLSGRAAYRVPGSRPYQHRVS